MGKSLYRQYRSSSFDEIIGQDHIVAVLKNSLKNDSISHAYLLSGPRGVGKTSTARILAHAVNDMAYKGENINLDIIEIDAASNRRIDEIRELRERVNIAPVAGKYKVYIIDEVHMLTREAFNALLKTLEEPPSHVIFILATTEAHKIPETILSRCIKLTFKPISDDLITNHLRNIAKKEKINIDDEALDQIAKHGQGSFRDSISLLEQIKFVNDPITVDDVREVLGLTSDDLINEIITQVDNADLKSVTESLNKAYEKGANESALASQLAEGYRNILINNKADDKESIIDLLRNLLLVPGSHNPRVALELALGELIISKPPKTTVPQVEYTDSAEPDRPVESTIEDARPPITEQTYTPTVEVKISPETIAHQNALWDELLKQLKTKNNTLYSIARLAVVEHKGDILEVKFKFAFHHKRMKEAKNRGIIESAIRDLTDKPPILEISLLDATSEGKDAKNEDLKTVSNIFGKGEVLES